jgi:hypothetical protein
MISSTRSLDAMKAMQHLCVMARFFTTENPEISFKILDAMDYLFTLLCSEDDKTQEFECALKDMIDTVPQCNEAMRIYMKN